MAASLNVLAIDGGGIRGLIPALVLAEIEARTGRPAAGLFDLVAGTSTGGLLALALAAPTPRRRAAEIARLYEREGPRIFSRTLWHRLTAAGNLLDQKYPARGLESLLEDVFGQTRLREAVVPVIIAAYELEGRFPFFFKSRKALRRDSHDFPMRVVARATSAAPTYFEPKVVRGAREDRSWGLVDGGVYANNPAMCAYAEALHTGGRSGRPIRVVSLGTGELTRPISVRAARGWGVVRWAGPMLEVIFDGVSDTVDYQLRQILPRDRYFRFQTQLTRASDDLDDASPENVERLKGHAAELLRESGERLDELCRLLLADADRSDAHRPAPDPGSAGDGRATASGAADRLR